MSFREKSRFLTKEAEFKRNKQKTLLHFELSNKCNSQCPGCPRYFLNTPVINPALTLSEVKYEDFVKWIPEYILQTASKINICGGHGDPILCTDLIKILEYIKINLGQSGFVEIRTNGGTRSEKFWKTLAEISNNRIVLIFSVDGLEDTNHKYRRNVKWNVLEKNIKTFTENGGIGFQECLLFKHNEHQKDEIKKWNSEIGLKEVTFKRPIGFDNYVDKKSKPMPVYDNWGDIDYLIEPANEYIPDGFVYDKNDFERNLPFIDKAKKSCDFNPDEINYDNYLHFNDVEIKCKSITDNSVEYYMNTHGTLYPCCYIPTHENIKVPIDEIKQIRKILDNSNNQYNLNYNSFENIIDLFDNNLVPTWDKKVEDGKCLYCSRQCGVDKSIQDLFVDGPPDYLLKSII